MHGRELIVLKLGGSVLTTEGDLPKAVHEIYRWVREGHRVVAVASALGGVTDRLLAKAKRWSGDPDPATVAELLATGERSAAALLALAVDRAGLACDVLDPSRIGLRVEGSPLDAAPRAVDAAAVLGSLQHRPVAIVPGFFGIRDGGGVGLLGRGGSDLTALFLASRLGARCRLIKDVPGLFERDPALPGPSPRWFRSVSYARALELDPRIIQHKGVRFARDAGLEVEVAALNSADPTRVWDGPTALEDAPANPTRLRLGLLGAGTVGRGVYEAVHRLPDLFSIAGIGVRSPDAHAKSGVPWHLLTTDTAGVVDGSDVLVEALPDADSAAPLVRAALEAGRHVVTANKALVARHGAEFEALAEANDARFLYSASVGGGAPILEAVSELGRNGGAEDGRIRSIEGVLNGTSSFVLDRLGEGLPLAQAVRLAQEAGFAEADPTADLDGTDIANKLVVIARLAFGVEVSPDRIERAGLETVNAAAARGAAASGRTLRLVATLTAGPHGLVATVAPRTLEPDDPLAARGERAVAVIRTSDGGEGRIVRIEGRGAGRHPTAESVIADLLAIARERHLHPAHRPSPEADAAEPQSLVAEVAP